MDKAGFTKIAVTLSLTSLLKKKMIFCEIDSDINGEEYFRYNVLNKGMEWLQNNEDRLILKKPKVEISMHNEEKSDSIPF